jgi:diguanylate cyclase (GGDEF)-like protein
MVLDGKFFLLIKDKENFEVRELKNKKYTIGRSPKNDIFLTALGISRKHSTIYYSKGSFWIVDGDLRGSISTNGIFVNQKKISVCQLNSFDKIVFQEGSEALFFSCKVHPNVPDLSESILKNLVDFFCDNDLSKKLVSGLENSDIAAQKTHASAINASLLDDLTRLPNRSAFFSRVQKTIEFSKRVSVDYVFAVLFIDVDRFKFVNDSLGHLAGDKYLICIAQKLGVCLREDDMVARLGGDEFAILLDDLRSPEEAMTVADRLQNSLLEPLSFDNHEIYPSLSIGIAFNSVEYKNSEEIVRDADTAMYHAKSFGSSKISVFDKLMQKKISEKLTLENDLRRALAKKELCIRYQPIVSIRDQCLTGFEALIRWEHPDLGLVSPTVFIPLAEEINLICQIGSWVLDEVCRQLSLWKANSKIKSTLSVNVNISAKQLSATDFLKNLLNVTQRYGIEPLDLGLEVTESILMREVEASLKLFKELNRLGFKLAIDDFGTGYSSLSYLNKFPIDTLKVDRSFISQINKFGENTSINITSSIISLAHSLGVKVVAEGIEDLYHLNWLKLQRCDYGQGFLFSTPLDIREATVLAETGLNWIWKC